MTQIDDGGNGIFAAYPKAQELFGVFEYKVILQVKEVLLPTDTLRKRKFVLNWFDL